MQTIKTVRARDLMRREVLTLAPGDTIEAALTLFEEARISGAPVMRPDGRLIGVLTLADVAKPEHMDGDHIDARTDDDDTDDADDEEPGEAFLLREDYDPEVLGHRRVEDWMTESVITVDPDATLQKVCRTMANAGIHRVFVVDSGKLVGVVSSFDVIRMLARD